MKNQLLTISVLTLLLAGQSAIAGESHDNDRAIDAFISSQHDARQDNGNVTMQKVSYSTSEAQGAASYESNKDPFSLDYSSDK